jgi:hypothetical protein
MTRRALAHWGILIAAALLLLNMTSCMLARTCSNSGLFVVPLPGATHVVDIGGISIYMPSLGFGESGLIVFYADSSRVAGERFFLPFCYWVNYGGPFALLSIAYWPLSVLLGVPSVLVAYLQRRRQQRSGRSIRPTSLSALDFAMARIQKKRRPLKWWGLAVSLLIAIAWMLSNWWVICRVGGDGYVYLWRGTVFRVCAAGNNGGGPGWKIRSRPFFDHSVSQRILDIWPPLLFIAASTAYLWLLDCRHAPPGHCPGCGYELTGNTSGVCPECGKRIERGADSTPLPPCAPVQIPQGITEATEEA